MCAAGRDLTGGDLLLDVPGKPEQREGAADLARVNPEGDGELSGCPSVERHEAVERLGLFHGLKVLAETVLDKLFGEDFGVAEVVFMEIAVDCRQTEPNRENP